MAEAGAKSKETAKAAQAFADYVALGPGRSLEKLEARYRADAEGAPHSHLSRLKIWSTEFEWQDRLKELAAAQTAEVTELERAILANGTRELYRRYGGTSVTAARTEELLSVLGHVKPKDANLNLGGTIVVRIVGAEVEAI